MRHSTRLPILLVSLLLTGCAAPLAHRQGLSLLSEGKVEEGLTKLAEAVREDPDNPEYRIHYRNARDKVIHQLLGEAQRAIDTKRFDSATDLLQRVQVIDRNNAQAAASLAALERARRHAQMIEEASKRLETGDTAAAEKSLALVLQENPQQNEARLLMRQVQDKSIQDPLGSPALGKAFSRPVTLEFRDANLKFVLEALSRHSGLNFVLDKDVQANLSITTFLRQVSVEQALDVILSTNNLAKRVLNDTTLLIYPDTDLKQSAHQDLVVRTFYLANASAKEVLGMLKTVLKAKNVYVDEKLNLLIMRDSPAMIDLAERLVAAQDVSEPEVMLDVEVVEVQRSKLLNLGIQFPDQLTLTPLSSNGTGLTLQDLKTIKSPTTGAAISPLIINLQDQVNDTNILANPRIRTHNREKAEIKIGDRVPIITTTSTSTGFVSNSVQYVDVGLKLEVEPTIYPDDQVAIKLGLEVSSVVKEITSKDGTTVYQIGSRNASTLLRLKDGETQVLGGLINDTDTSAANRFPGLGDFPILGRLFSSQKDNIQKQELLLSITPHLVRSLTPALQVPTRYWSGTENSPRLKPLATVAPVAEAAASPSQAAAQEAPRLVEKTAVADAAPAGPPALLRWDGAPEVKAGSRFKLVLKVSNREAVTGFPVQIKYDPAIYEAVDVKAGSYMRQGDIPVEFTKRIVGAAGMVFITQNRGGTEGVQGDGDLVEIEFKALKPAQGSVITALPTLPLGVKERPTRMTGPALIGLTVTP